MSEMLYLAAEVRKDFGTGAARALKRSSKVPAIIYGNGRKSVAVSIEEKEITKRYRKPNFISTVIELDVEGTKYKVLPHAVQLHPVTDIVVHVDFVYLSDSVQKLFVPVVFEGKERAIGVKRGGFFNIIKRKIPIECPVDMIPLNVVVDVTNMHVGQSIKASKITLPDQCKLASKQDFLVASIIGSRGAASAEETAEAKS